MANIEYYAVVKSGKDTLFRITNTHPFEEMYSSFFPELASVDERVRELHAKHAFKEGWAILVYRLNTDTWAEEFAKGYLIQSPILEAIK